GLRSLPQVRSRRLGRTRPPTVEGSFARPASVIVSVPTHLHAPICVSFFAQGIFFAAGLSVHVAASSFPQALVGADDIPRRGHLRWDLARSCLSTARPTVHKRAVLSGLMLA